MQNQFKYIFFFVNCFGYFEKQQDAPMWKSFNRCPTVCKLYWEDWCFGIQLFAFVTLNYIFQRLGIIYPNGILEIIKYFAVLFGGWKSFDEGCVDISSLYIYKYIYCTTFWVLSILTSTLYVDICVLNSFHSKYLL